VGPGARVLLLAAPSPDLYALALALLAIGSTLVLVDGRMARRRILEALGDAKPTVVIAAPAVLHWWPLVGALRRAHRFTLGGRVFGARAVESLAEEERWAIDVADIGDTPAIISFSSGNTGKAKRVVRTHAVLLAQHRALFNAFPVDAGDVNLAGFPLAVLHNLCCGSTSVIAHDFSRAPSKDDALSMLAAIRARKVTSVSGSPACIASLAAAALATPERGRGVRRVVVGGGPVSRRLCEEVLRAFPEADSQIVYGATEAEPIATAPMVEACVALGAGYLVGRPVRDCAVAVLAAGASSVPSLPSNLEPRTSNLSPIGATGEIVVRGAHVASADPSGWHRTGDLGRVDERGRLWLVGRVGASVTHRDNVLHPFAVEANALSERGVAAAALVSHRRAPNGELVVTLNPDADARATLAAVRMRLDDDGLAELPLRIVSHIPMDARHASKVARTELARRLERGWSLR
jgi:acyl-coenzyme A synthetase/AMP-(fatty) acid ligase